MGQTFHNPYERLKLESEIVLKQASRELGVEVKIFRPSIVIGNAPATQGGLPSNLLFAFFRMLLVAGVNTAGRNTQIRIRGLPSARFNIVPIEYVAAAITQLSQDNDASGGTFHLVASNPPTQNEVAEIIRADLGLHEFRVLGPGDDFYDPSPIELKLRKMLRPYKEYLGQDVRFDDTVARLALNGHGLYPPVIDDEEIMRLIELAGTPIRHTVCTPGRRVS